MRRSPSRPRTATERRRKVSTPLPDDDYPEAWRPRERRERDQQNEEFERLVARLSDEEIKRIRAEDR